MIDQSINQSTKPWNELFSKISCIFTLIQCFECIDIKISSKIDLQVGMKNRKMKTIQSNFLWNFHVFSFKYNFLNVLISKLQRNSNMNNVHFFPISSFLVQAQLKNWKRHSHQLPSAMLCARNQINQTSRSQSRAWKMKKWFI